MCFSAVASFAGGAVLTATGAVTVSKARKSPRLIFASIPLLFGAQQIAEGFIWMALQHQQFLELKEFFTYYFLVMADAIWPTMIPLAFFVMETNKKRKNILKYMLGAGIILSLYYLVCMIIFHVEPQISEFHIQYINGFPMPLGYFAFGVYAIVTLAPFFLSEIKRTNLLGILMTISCVVTGIFYTQYLVSVWCFFAALLSAVILWIMIEYKKEKAISNK